MAWGATATPPPPTPPPSPKRASRRSIRWVRSAICSDSWRTCSELAPPPAAGYPEPPPELLLARVSTAATTPRSSVICCSRRSIRPEAAPPPSPAGGRGPANRAAAGKAAMAIAREIEAAAKDSHGHALLNRPCPVFRLRSAHVNRFAGSQVGHGLLIRDRVEHFPPRRLPRNAGGIIRELDERWHLLQFRIAAKRLPG